MSKVRSVMKSVPFIHKNLEIASIQFNLIYFFGLNLFFPSLFHSVDEHKPSETIASKTATATDNSTATIESIKSGDDNLDVKLAAEIPAADELKALNNLAAANEAVAAVNKTTATVTVNVTQTKVVLDEVDKAQSIGAVVSTVSSIAEAAVNAIEKPQPPLPSAEVASSEPIESSTIENDIEMLEADDDCEMKDLSAIENQQQQPQLVSTTTAAVDSKNNASAVVTSQSNEAEQKIDDVEKNISNLFNGDDNVGSTNDKSPNVSLSGGSDSLKISSAHSQSNTDLHKNGTGGDEAANKDNNDLVSILAGSDKLDENISSSINVSAKSSDSNNTTAPTAAVIANKLLKGITSTPSNYTPQTNVFNSTPIQKQFEISSENVSTISESGAIDTADQNAGVGGKAAKQEIISSHSSTTPEKSSSDLSTTNTGLFCPILLSHFE